MTSAPARAWTTSANAASMSRSAAAFTTTRSSPRVRAAVCTLGNSVPTATALFGLTSNATVEVRGTSSCSRCKFFVGSASMRKYTPVTLRLGRLRLTTKPDLTGSAPLAKTIGIVAEPPWLPAPQRCSRQGRPLAGGAGQPPMLAGDRIAPPPSDIRSRRSGLRYSWFLSGLE